MGKDCFSIEYMDVTDANWMEYVEMNPDATFFHHPTWSIVLSKTYGYRSFVLAVKDVGGQIVGGLPLMEINSWLTGKRWVSLAFTDHCKVLVRDKEALEALAEKLINETAQEKTLRVEIRDNLPPMNGAVSKKSHYVHYLSLGGNEEKLFRSFRKKGVQYCIKKGLKNDVVVSRRTSDEAVLDFYDLHLLTRKKLGVPIQPRKYFVNLWREIINQNMGFVALAHYHDKPIAGGVFLHYRGKLIYKYGATDPRYLNVYANHALLWEVIKWASSNGFEVFDWGKTEKNDEGLRKFKLGWGTNEEELGYTYINRLPLDYSAGWKKRITEKTVQKCPVWVCRALGELLYKHTA
jgi:lipid II:glycine glycyltransferase (peptidoglycan interpeptide bridge formation enzyme)